jgi:hypothetical protein
VTNTKQEEAGIYTLDKKVLLFLGPLAFRKKKGKISLKDGSGTVLKKIRHKMYIFLKSIVLLIQVFVIRICCNPKERNWILFMTNLAVSDC